MAEEHSQAQVVLSADLTPKEKALAYAFGRPSSPTFKKRNASMREAGYGEGTIRSKGHEIMKKPRVRDAINSICITEAGTENFEGDKIDAIKTFLRRSMDFDVTKCFETVEYEVPGKKGGPPVMRRELQAVNLVDAGIDGRLLDSMKITNTLHGQNIEFKPVPKIQSARLLASMEGALEEGGSKGQTTVNLYFGAPLDPNTVNGFDEFREEFRQKTGRALPDG